MTAPADGAPQPAASESGNEAALDPEIERLVRDSFGKQGLMRHLGATMLDVRRGEVRIRMPFRPELTQQHGFFHAGGTSAIADTAGGYAGLTVFPRGSAVLTVEFKINLVAPAKGDALVAVGRVLKAGRTLTVCQLEVFAEQARRLVSVAVGQQTLICLNEPGTKISA
jgi:uncharacterized protein (TIGR00369 family)